MGRGRPGRAGGASSRPGAGPVPEVSVERLGVFTFFLGSSSCLETPQLGRDGRQAQRPPSCASPLWADSVQPLPRHAACSFTPADS